LNGNRAYASHIDDFGRTVALGDRRASSPDDGAEGVIVAQGGAYAGWSLYVKNGKPTY
jgi:hypothetical protein